MNLLFLIIESSNVRFLWLAIFPVLCGEEWPPWVSAHRLSSGPTLRSLFTCILPIRKWGRNSEFRFDLHPGWVLFFCSYREKQWDFCVWKGGHSAWRPDEQCWRPWGPSPSLSPCMRLQEGEAPGLRVWFPPSHELLGHVLQLCLLLGVRWQSARGPVRTCPSCPERGPSALDGQGLRVGALCSSTPLHVPFWIMLGRHLCPQGTCVLKMISPGAVF